MAVTHLLVLTSLVTLGAFSDDFSSLELTRYEDGVKVVYEQLYEEGCLNKKAAGKMKRNLLSIDSSGIKLEMTKRLYNRLINQLAECRKNTLEIVALPTTKIPTAATNISITTTMRLTTIQIPVPAECRRAINLTESWRMEHNGGQIKPNGNWNCDTREMVNSGRPWFRFSGAAGNRIYNKCLQARSCGTNTVLWSDDPTPSSIGVISQITAYGNGNHNVGVSDWMCRYYKKKMSVMRCSNKPHDFVYRYDDDDASCDFGFCGMSE